VTSVSKLGLYETAYLCGGAQRVAVAAVVAMVDDGRLKISRTRHRVQVVRRSATEAIERAVLDAVPGSGRVLGPLLLQVADSAAVKELISGLRDAGLVGHHVLAGHPHLTAEGRRVRKELEGSLARTRGERRVAVLGIGGITDAGLRDVFESPDPPAGGKLLPQPPRSGPAGGRPEATEMPMHPGISDRW
jgi:hypothetical protein